MLKIIFTNVQLVNILNILIKKPKRYRNVTV
jgi:hypothetical protein